MNNTGESKDRQQSSRSKPELCSMSEGQSQDPVYENRAYGIQSIETKTDNAYVEYDDKRKREEEDGWLSLCLACLMCR